jgi:predicted ester cyclase
MNKASVREFYEESWVVYANQHLSLDEVFGQDNKLCVRFTNTGSHVGELVGVPPTGREITMEGMTVMHFRDGKCMERWPVVDIIGPLAQMGALPWAS